MTEISLVHFEEDHESDFKFQVSRRGGEITFWNHFLPSGKKLLKKVIQVSSFKLERSAVCSALLPFASGFHAVARAKSL